MSNVLEMLIDDKDFMSAIEERILSVMQDGKIDAMDIPDITLLVIECTSNFKKFNLTLEELPELLNEILTYVFKKYDVVPDDQEEKFLNMINTVVKLVLLQPYVKKGIKKIISKLSCCKKSN